MYPNIYDMEGSFDYGGVIDKMEELGDKIQEESEKEEVDKEKIFNLRYAKFIQGLKLNTGYVNLWGR